MIIRIILTLLVLCQTVLATTYYVDWENGSDTNNGTTTATPFKRVPGMATATGTAKATVLAPGDVVAFKGGVTHFIDATIICRTGVTYDGEVWGTGRAIIDRNNTPGTGISVGTASNVTIKRLQIQNIGGYAEDDPIWDGITISSVNTETDTFTSAANHSLVVGDDVMWTSDATLPAPLTDGRNVEKYFYVVAIPTPTTFQVSTVKGGSVLDITSTGSGTIKAWEPVNPGPEGVGISIKATTGGVLIEDVALQELGQWQRKPPMRGVGSVSGAGIRMEDSNGVTIRRVTGTKTSAGIVIQADTVIQNILVDDCELKEYLKWGIDIAPRNSNAEMRNITVQNTDIYNYHQYDSGNWESFGEKPHTDGIFLRNAAAYNVLWENVKINACRFWQDTERGGKGGTADIYISYGPSVTITNCIFHRPKHASAIRIAYPPTKSRNPQVVRIYNNAFLNGAQPVYTATETNPERKMIHVQNNIFVRSGSKSDTMVNHQGGVVFATLNNNLYFAANYPVTEKSVAYLNGDYRTLGKLQALGFELNGAWGNPLWPVQTGNFADINWTIPANSPAVGTGANLSEFFTTDALGNPRPSTGAWDLGPYVSGVAPPADTTPPTLTGRAVDATGKVLTLTFSETVEGVNPAHYSMSGYTLNSAAGTGQVWTMAITPAVQAGLAVSLGYVSGIGRTQDLAGNPLASGTFSVINGSLEQTPDPPKPGRKGTNAKRLIRR